MSYIKTVDIECDCCLHWHTGAATARETWKIVKRIGWKSVGKKHYCQHCAPRFRRVKKT